MANEVKISLAVEGASAVISDMDRVGSSVVNMGTKVKDAMQANTAVLDRFGMSAKATSAALRGVPAQFTDIITSLQGGQAPLTVFLQQGGQLKDMFGGAGNAARALGGYIAGLVNPFTVAVGSAVALAAAYEQGAGESRALEKSLILSGNQAGVTTGQLMAMAASIDQVAGTQGNAAQALATMASGARVGGDNLEQFTTTAIKFERVTGTAVEETAKKFAELRKSPLEATLKLNESMGYLTQATYDQIKALTEQGKAVDAALLAQQAFDKATASMAADIQANLGLVERSWNKVTGAVKEAWDSIKDIGRDAGLEGQVAAAQKMVDVRRQAASSIYASDSDLTKLSEAENQLKGYQDLLKNQQLSAKYAAERNEQVKQGAEWDKLGAKYLGDTVKMQRDIAAARELGLQAGKSAVEIAQRESEIRKSYDKKGGKSPGDPFSADRAAAKEWAKFYEDFVDLGAQAESKVLGLSKAQAKLVDYLQSPAYANMGEPARQLALESAYAAIASEQLADSIKTSEKAATAAAAAHLALVNAQDKRTEGIAEQVRKQLESNAAIGLAADALGELESANILTRAAELERKADLKDGVMWDLAITDGYRKEAQALRDLADAKLAGGLKKANFESARDAAKEWEKAAAKINDSITDALMRGFESGKGFAENLRDTVVNMFKTLVLRPIVSAVVNPVAQGITGMMGMSGAANAGGMGGMASLFNGASTAASSGMGWLTNFGGSVASSAGSVGSWLSGTGSESMQQLGGMIGRNTVAIGQYAQTAGSALGYLNAAVMASQGKWGAAIGSGLGTYFFGPIGGAIGSAIGGWVDKAFGGGSEYAVGSGISGNVSSAGFAGRNYKDWQNDGSSGLFGIGGARASSGRNFSALDSATSDQFSAAFLGVQSAAAGMATSLGLDAQKITQYSQDISVALGSDAEANKKAIEALFKTIADGMAAKVAPSIATMAKDGETASATLARLSTSITTANGWLSMLRQRLFQVSLAGGDAASKLADAFGGLDQLSANSKAFYDTYYTEGEKVANSQRLMTDALAAVNLALPTSKDALKALAGTLDLNTEYGRAAYATLLAIAPEFATTADAIAKFSSETAIKLMSTFTGNGQLVPALDAVSLKTDAAATAANSLSGYLTLVDAAPVGASMELANTYLRGLDGKPVDASITGINSMLKDVDGRPLALVVGNINAALGNTPSGLSTAIVDAGGKVSTLTTSISGSGQLIYHLTDAAGKTTDFAGGISQINKIMGDPTSGVITTISKAAALGQPLVGAQIAASMLHAQLADLKDQADKTRINFAGLTTALSDVNTETFVATIAAVFENLASRIQGVIGDINTERVAVAEAALQIINPAQRSGAQIRGDIDATIGGSGSAQMIAAQGALDSADAALAMASKNQAAVNASALNASAALSVAQTAKTDTVNYYAAQNAQLRALGAAYSPAGTSIRFNATGENNDAYNYNAATNQLNGFNSIGYSNYTNTLSNGIFGSVSTAYNPDVAGMKKDPRYAQLNAILTGGSAALATAAANIAKAQAVSVAAQAAIGPVTVAQAAAQTAAKSALLAYTAATDAYIVQASKAVPRLTKLREETVKYYESQKALAELMTKSASGIRDTITAYSYSQKTDEQKFQDLAAQFSAASLLAKSTTGEALAAQGDKINALINPLIEIMKATGRDSKISDYLTQAEGVAKLVDAGVKGLGDYQADSLSMLGSIDKQLALLDDGTQTIARAIKAGGDATLNGLAAVVGAITKTTPPSTSAWGGAAFATGGAFTNGVVSRPTMFDIGLMGEDTSEGILPLANVGGRLGVHARIGGGGQGGNTARMEALLETLIKEVAELKKANSLENIAIASHAATTSDAVKSMDRNGVMVYNDPAEPLQTTVAA
ncbi:MAG: phage tail length tape measure family protein [Rhodoferax sp.]|nr:phage tail length tape measure family protein [Rhodoferax sp.]MDP3651046.1 phage tail length tape measure family protein [Rhodoferax sp.]